MCNFTHCFSLSKKYVICKYFTTFFFQSINIYILKIPQHLHCIFFSLTLNIELRCFPDNIFAESTANTHTSFSFPNRYQMFAGPVLRFNCFRNNLFTQINVTHTYPTEAYLKIRYKQKIQILIHRIIRSRKLWQLRIFPSCSDLSLGKLTISHMRVSITI